MKDKNAYNYVYLDKQTEKDRHWNKQTPAQTHTGRKIEEAKKTYKYVDSDTQTKKDRHWNKQTPAHTHTGKKSERQKNIQIRRFRQTNRERHAIE